MSYINSVKNLASTAKPRRAFQTDDGIAVLKFAADSLDLGFSTALVTLLEIRGGAARPVGSQMAVREDGHYCGLVSGGCVEHAAAFEALDAIALGEDRQVAYGQGSPYIDIILPCGGGITLGIHVVRSAQPLVSVLGRLDGRQPAWLRYMPTEQYLDVLSQGRDTRWRDGGLDILYRPHPRIVVHGRSLEAEVTKRLALAAGYEVRADRSADLGEMEGLIDADTAIVLLYHDLDQELPVLQAALSAKPFYIGALGSSRTHQARVEHLAALGYSTKEIERIKAPIGLFPRARDASSLALSILAEIAATRSGRG